MVDGRIGRAPSVRRARVHVDFRRQSCLRKRVAKHVLGFWLVLVVVLSDREQIVRLHLGHEEMRAIGFIRHQPTAVERRDGTDAIWDRRRRGIWPIIQQSPAPYDKRESKGPKVPPCGMLV